MERRPTRKNAEARAMHGARFKIACAHAGLKVEDVAQLLHVSLRTVQYWFAGKTAVPFAAYKLVRVINAFELPGDRWAGWHMHSGKLWTPEGFGFDPVDGAWWSLLVRQARGFNAMYLRCVELQAELKRVGASGTCTGAGEAGPGPGRGATEPAEGPHPWGGAAGRREAPARNLLLGHFGTEGSENTPLSLGSTPQTDAMKFIAKLLAAANLVAPQGGGQ